MRRLRLNALACCAALLAAGCFDSPDSGDAGSEAKQDGGHAVDGGGATGEDAGVPGGDSGIGQGDGGADGGLLDAGARDGGVADDGGPGGDGLLVDPTYIGGYADGCAPVTIQKTTDGAPAPFEHESLEVTSYSMTWHASSACDDAPLSEVAPGTADELVLYLALGGESSYAKDAFVASAVLGEVHVQAGVVSAPATAVELYQAPGTTSVGNCTTLQVAFRDAEGERVERPVDTPLTFTSDDPGVVFSPNDDCSEATNPRELTIGRLQPYYGPEVYFRAANEGSFGITVSDPAGALTGQSIVVSVVPPVPTALELSPSSQQTSRFTCEDLTLTVVDSVGFPVPLAADEAVTLTGSGMHLYVDADCATEDDELVIPAGAVSITMSASLINYGLRTLTATGASLGAATATLNAPDPCDGTQCIPSGAPACGCSRCCSGACGVNYTCY